MIEIWNEILSKKFIIYKLIKNWEILREKLSSDSYKVTNKLKVNIKKNCRILYNWTSIYVKISDLEKFILIKYNISIII